jgi:hypothetical protein
MDVKRVDSKSAWNTGPLRVSNVKVAILISKRKNRALFSIGIARIP